MTKFKIVSVLLIVSAFFPSISNAHIGLAVHVSFTGVCNIMGVPVVQTFEWPGPCASTEESSRQQAEDFQTLES